MLNPKVIDISHYDAIVGNGFHDVVKFGIVGVIHKASEGAAMTDAPYAARRKLATSVGLLWGAYHFIRPGHVQEQVDLFLRVAKPDDHTLLALDYEDPKVSLEDARAFVEAVEDQSGRSCVVYSGATMKDALGRRLDPFWGERRLWLAQYAPERLWKWQQSWRHPWLVQFTGDGLGPMPHSVPGIRIAGGLDISHFDGTDDDLRAQWSGMFVGDPVYPQPDPPPPPPIQGRNILFYVAGRMSTFGGPQDKDVQSHEGLALFGNDAQMAADILGGDWVLTAEQAGAPGLARRINPAKHYVAARWRVKDYPLLRTATVWVENAAGTKLAARAVDWGPSPTTGRACDLSPGLAADLGLDTDDHCAVTVYADGK